MHEPKLTLVQPSYIGSYSDLVQKSNKLDLGEIKYCFKPEVAGLAGLGTNLGIIIHNPKFSSALVGHLHNDSFFDLKSELGKAVFCFLRELCDYRSPMSSLRVFLGGIADAYVPGVDYPECLPIFHNAALEAQSEVLNTLKNIGFRANQIFARWIEPSGVDDQNRIMQSMAIDLKSAEVHYEIY